MNTKHLSMVAACAMALTMSPQAFAKTLVVEPVGKSSAAATKLEAITPTKTLGNPKGVVIAEPQVKADYTYEPIHEGANPKVTVSCAGRIKSGSAVVSDYNFGSMSRGDCIKKLKAHTKAIGID